MKVLLLGLLASVLLCGCAANTPYSETMTDTSAQTHQRVLPDAPSQGPIKFQPGLDSGSAMGAFGGQ
jgi:outer membrane lipoprotein SlyB